MTEFLTESTTERAIDAATKRNGRIFIAYIVVLLVTALIIAIFTWLTWDSGNKLQDAIRADATARIADATKDLPALQTAASDAKAAQQKIETELERQKERTAVAERALLELQEHNRPRHLTADQQARITTKAKSFAGTTFDIAASNSREPLDLVIAIEDTLVGAGWTELDWSVTNITIGRPGRHLLGIAAETGVTVQVETAQQLKLLEIAKNLAAALSAEGIVAEAQLMPPPQKANQEAIHIVVGEKPK